MQTLDIAETKIVKTPGFLMSQFTGIQTSGQKRFDWACGVALPIVCIAADPIVFRSALGANDALFPNYQVGAYILSATAIMANAAWLLWGDRLGELRPYIAGLLFVSALVSTAVGIVLIPFSLLGLMVFLYGALGFTPLFSGFVLMRSAVRAFRGSTGSMPRKYVWRAALLAALYAAIVPIVLNF